MTIEYKSEAEILVAMALRARNQIRASRKTEIRNIADEFPDFWQLVQFDLNEGRKSADPVLAKALGIDVPLLNKIVKQKLPIPLRDARKVADRVLAYLRTLADAQREESKASSDQQFTSDGVPIDWKNISDIILFRLQHVDAALKQLRPIALQIAAAKAEGGAGRIGHNNPPPNQMLTPADLEETDAAKVLLQEAFRSSGPKNVNVLRLGEKVLARVGAIAEWMAGIGKAAVEEYVRAAAEQAGKKTIDVIFYLKLIAALGAAATATAVAIHAIPI